VRTALVLAAFSLFAALPVRARESADLADKVATDLEAWDIEGARRGLDNLLHEDRTSAIAAFLQGRVLFEQGDYEAAAKSFEESVRRGAPAGDVDSQLRLARATAEEVKNDEVHESAHFVLRTRPGKDALLVPYALEGLEKAYAALTKDLGVSPPAKIRVEVYETAQALSRVSPLTVAEIKASGTIALCKYNRLMITSPRALLRGYAWLDTLSHEFVHFLVTQKGRNSVPIWLQEGLAKFLETRWRGAPGLAVDEMSLVLLHKAAKDNKLIPFAAMHPSIAKLPTQEAAALAFAEVEAAIRVLYLHGGQQALTELVAAMAAGARDEKAVSLAYGKSFAQFEKDWRESLKELRKEPPAQAPGAARPLERKALVFKEDAKGAAKDGGEMPGERPVDPEAKRSVRLGEIFYARRRWAAAAQEYGKARSRMSREIPQIARRYAFAQVQLGHLGEAEAALASAAQRDPQDEAVQALYAHVLQKRGQPQKAKAALEAGIAVDPFDPELHDVYVRVAKDLKDQALTSREENALAVALGRKARPATPGSEGVDSGNPGPNSAPKEGQQ
jgi:predicted Zn-dependent protease